MKKTMKLNLALSVGLLLGAFAGLGLPSLQAQVTPLAGDHHITVEGSESGHLELDGGLSIGGNLIDFGTTGASDSALSWLYDESSSIYTLSLSATRDNVSFLWRENAGGTAVAKMKLDADNVLSLYDASGNVGLTLSPLSGISLPAGRSLTLSDGTVLSGAASFRQSALYDAGGTARVVFDGSGNLVVSPLIKAGGGVEFAPDVALNADNAAYLKEILHNLGYREEAAPEDLAVVLPANFSIGYAALDAAGNMYVAGTFSGEGRVGSANLVSAGNSDGFVAKFNSSGVPQWAARLGGTGSDSVAGIAVDGSGNVYLAGSFSGTLSGLPDSLVSAGSNDVFVAQFNSSGTAQWGKRFGGSSNDVVQVIAVDGSGNAYLAGYFSGTLSSGLPDSLVSAGSSDVFVAQFNSSGTAQWGKRLGGSSGDYARGIAVDGSGNAYLAGYFSGTLSSGLPDSLVSAGSSDVFVAKFNSSGTAQWGRRFGGAISEQTVTVALNPSGALVLAGSGSSNFWIGNQIVSRSYAYSGSETSLLSDPMGTTDAFSWGSSKAAASSAVALGANALANATGSVALGGSISSGEYAFAAGIYSTASGSNSTAIGGSTASGSNSTAMGGSTASGLYSTAMGRYSTASGEISTAMGYNTTASGVHSTAMGRYSTASGEGSTAMGGSTASGFISTAMGGSMASGYASAAMGASTASGEYSAAMGISIASGYASAAMGYSTASGETSTAMGFNTTASGLYSTAMGSYSTASGLHSTAMGSYSTASGETSAAMGNYSTASGYASAAMGYTTYASFPMELAIGHCNVPEEFSSSLDLGDLSTLPSTGSLFVIGNGASPYTPSNAFVVRRNGETRIAHRLQAKGGVRVPEQGDLSMGDFRTSPAGLDDPAELDPATGLRYSGE